MGGKYPEICAGLAAQSEEQPRRLSGLVLGSSPGQPTIPPETGISSTGDHSFAVIRLPQLADMAAGDGKPRFSLRDFFGLVLALPLHINVNAHTLKGFNSYALQPPESLATPDL